MGNPISLYKKITVALNKEKWFLPFFLIFVIHCVFSNWQQEIVQCFDTFWLELTKFCFII